MNLIGANYINFLRLVFVIVSVIFVSSCNSIGTTKVKSIIDLTPKLLPNSSEAIILDDNLIKDCSEWFITPETQNILKIRAKINAEPLLARGVWYVLDNDGVISAFARQDKKLLWSYSLISDKSMKINKLSYIGGGITYYKDRLYVTNGSKFLFILDAVTGNEIMRKEFPDIIRIKPVLLDDQNILIQTISQQLFAYNIIDYKLTWEHQDTVETLGSSNYIPPTVYDGYVIVAYNSGRLFALDLKNGNEKWGLNLSHIGDKISLPNYESEGVIAPIIAQGKDLYIARANNALTKINLSDGAVIWNIDASDVQSIYLHGNSIFITTNAMQVVALSTLNGKIKWCADLVSNSDNKKSKPMLMKIFTPFITKVLNENGTQIENLNVVTADGMIYSFQITKNIISQHPLIRKIASNIQYIGTSCCNDLYFVLSNRILFE